MLYTVEIRVSADRFGEEMGQMRTWLDHMGYQTLGYRAARGLPACRIDFDKEAEAAAFARAFAGRVLPAVATVIG